MKPITLFLLCGALLAQTHGVAIPDPSANLPAQKIGPRDLIVLQVYDSPELSRTVRIGADGMIVEVHPCPEKAVSDGYQSLTPAAFKSLMAECRKVATALGKSM